MTKRWTVDEGTRVIRKRDGAPGVIVRRHAVVSRPFGTVTTLLDVRLDDAALRLAAGGDMTGDLGWFASNFRKGDV